VFFYGFGGFVELGADVVLQVFQRRPAGRRRYVKGFVVLVFVVG
jgi:hypothetical protein